MILEISFPNGLKTNYNIDFPNTQQMIGRAEIITEDLRVIERLIQPVKMMLQSQ